jgi:chromosome segregation ATPase
MENKPEIKEKSNKALIVLIVLLACLCGYLIWENRTLQKNLETGTKTLNEVNAERSEVKGELEEMLVQYQEMENSNEGLSKELAEEKEKIEALLKKVKAKDWSIYKLKKETESLRKIMKGFVVQIDSLNQVNGRLTEENKVVKNKLNSEKDKTKKPNNTK